MNANKVINHEQARVMFIVLGCEICLVVICLGIDIARMSLDFDIISYVYVFPMIRNCYFPKFQVISTVIPNYTSVCACGWCSWLQSEFLQIIVTCICTF